MTRASTVRTTPQPSKPEQEQARESDPLNLAPHSVEAEEAVLGSILMNPEALSSVADFLNADAFFILRHSWIYEAMLFLWERQEPIDNRTLAERLMAQGRLDDVGGEAYLNFLPTTMPTALHAEVYGQLVERAAIRRRLLGAAGEIARLAHDEERDINEVSDSSETALYEALGSKRDTHIASARQAMSEYFDELEARREGEGGGIGLPTGFIDLDKLLSGLYGGDLVTVAGRPGMGKTALALSVVRNAAPLGARIGLFSMEMSRKQLIARLASMETEIGSQALKTGEVSDAEWSRFVDASDRISKWRLMIDDSPSLSIQQLRSRVMRFSRQQGLDLVIVDGLWLMNDGGATRKSGSEVAAISYITRNAKEIAREFNVPLIMVSQLNRNVENRSDKRPQLADLRSSGSIEQDSDIVMFLYRDEVYNEATERPGEADIIIAKHRNGPAGTVTLLFRKELAQFRNMRRRHVNLSDLGGGTEKRYTYAQITERGAAR